MKHRTAMTAILGPPESVSRNAVVLRCRDMISHIESIETIKKLWHLGG